MFQIKAASKMHILPTVVLFAMASMLLPSQVAAVQYGVEFVADWSAGTHPEAYPSGAHFSPLIGATHNEQVTFWEPGGIASPGIERMAETGGTSTLSSELNAAGGDVDTIILASGLGSPGSRSTTFEIVPSHSLVTLVTMVAPSPDWFVGVSGLNLRNGDAWVPQLSVELFAYDAGTDSGVGFTSQNADVTPHLPITLLGAPIPSTPPLGTYTFTLLGDFDQDGDIDGVDFLKWQRGESPNPFSAADLAAWEANFGAAVPLSATLTVVPEPRALLLGAMANLIWISFRRHSNASRRSVSAELEISAKVVMWTPSDSTTINV